MSDEENEKALKILRSITELVTEEEKEQARLVVEYLKFLTSGRDYEGTQSFPIEDYKRRN